MIRRLQRESEIVHRENVFEKFRPLKISDPAGLPRRIELVRHGIGPRVEIMIIERLVDAHSPQHNRWPVPIAADHPANIVDGQILPCCVTNVLPSRNLFQDKEADFIAGVKEMPRLRIVRRPHDIAMELVAENIGITTLRATGHRLPDERECLMTVKPAQFDYFAVKFKTAIGEFSVPETEAPRVLVEHLASLQQSHANAVKISVL